MSSGARTCARCESVSSELHATGQWGRICPACWRVYEETFRHRSGIERLGLVLVVMGLALWGAYLLLVVLNLLV